MLALRSARSTVTAWNSVLLSGSNSHAPALTVHIWVASRLQAYEGRGMETLFLACFVFGALVTLASAILGLAQSAAHGTDGGPLGPLPHGSDMAHSASHGAPALPGDGGHGELASGTAQQTGHHGLARLPLLNVSSLLAFITWFGAAGYLVLRFTASPLPAVAGALLGGTAGAVAIALFLAIVRQGERVMDPEEYRLKGTVARVTVRIPPDGVGEIVFSKAGVRRSEAARSLYGEPIGRDAEVVIVDYTRGVAKVVPLEASLRRLRQRRS